LTKQFLTKQFFSKQLSNMSTHTRLYPRKQLTPLARGIHACLLGIFATGIASAADSPEAKKESPEVTLPVIPVRSTAEEESASGPAYGYVAKRTATATKTDTPINETPQSISVITADRIQTLGATNLTEALAYTPGINSSPWGDLSQYDWVYMRGFDAYSPGFYLDGLPLRNSGSWGIWKTESYGSERIEVLRGPSSVLYGQGGPGGVINEVSKRPTAEPLQEIKMQLGNYSNRQVAGDFSGPLNEDGTLLYRAVGLGRDAELSTGGLPDDRLFIAPSLTWLPADDTTLTALSQFQRIRNGAVWPAYPAQGTLLPNPNGKVSDSIFAGESDFSRYNQDQWLLGYLLEHEINDAWTVRQNARYGHFDTDYKVFYNGDFVTVNESDPTSPENFRLMSRTPFGSKEDANAVVVDNQAQSTMQWGNWQHTLLSGLDYQRMRIDVQASYGGFAPDIDLYAPVHVGGATLDPPYIDTKTTLSQTGFYVQDQIKLNQHWVATIGGRYDRATVDTDDRLSETTSKQTDTEFTGRAGLVYLAPNGWAPYASYSESFSPSTTVDPDTGKPFKSETGRQYEAGLRFQPLGREDSYGIAVFDLRRQNYVSYDEDFTPQQTGEILVRGLELEATLQPFTGANLIAAYTWTPKAEVTASAKPEEIGKQANAVRENQFSLWADYRLAAGLKFGVGVRYMDSTHGANSASTAAIPAYTLLDALLGYNFDRWSFALNVQNLTDKTYIANCDGTGTSCSYGAARTINGTLTRRW
jgi:iron complex outermembrane receptor protein